MFQNKCKRSGVIKNEPQRDRIPKKDVELCLEVEMDDEVRQIITSPEKCASTLLDVTVIKPKALDQVYSHKATLSGAEVKKLIASMELEKEDTQKIIDKILATEDPKSSGDYVKRKYAKKVPFLPKADRQRISTTDDTNSDPVFIQKQRPNKKGDERIQQIYTTPKAYSDIKSIFTCKNKNKYDQDVKLDRPCLCRNCAIIGVLTDSQKKPFVTENLYDPRELLPNNRKESKESRRKKCVNFKNDNDDHIECEYYFRHLSAKIRLLEDRLSTQEEKSVPRDYFKRIITKLVTHLGKITSYAGYESTYTRPKSKEAKDSSKSRERYGENRYHVHPVLVNPKLSKTDLEEFLPNPNTVYASDNYRQAPDSFWKWGEEILRPGIDLKNKIVLLLEETLHSLKKTNSVPSRIGATEKGLAGNVEAPQKLQVEEPVRDLPAQCVCKNCPFVSNNLSVTTLTKLKKSKSYDKKRRKGTQSRQNTTYEQSLNVSYLNPQMKRWEDESQVSFKLESSDVESLKRPDDRILNEAYKAEFKNTLSHTKESDKLKLWQSVWTQARMNGQNKDDRVTIQMPDRKNLKSNTTIEIEYTIAELEELLIGLNQNNRKQSKKRSDRK